MTVARRGLCGVNIRELVAWWASSVGKAGRFLSTLGGSALMGADDDEVLWSLKISPAAKTLRGKREDRVV